MPWECNLPTLLRLAGSDISGIRVNEAWSEVHHRPLAD